MRKILLIISLGLISIGLISGCKKSTETPSTPAFTRGMTFKYAKKTFISDSADIYYSSWSSGLYYWRNIADGTNAAALNFELTRMVPGEYNIDYTNSGSIAYQGVSRVIVYGKLVITDSNTYIKGTFNFTTADSQKVTDGVFNVRFP